MYWDWNSLAKKIENRIKIQARQETKHHGICMYTWTMGFNQNLSREMRIAPPLFFTEEGKPPHPNVFHSVDSFKLDHDKLG